MPTANMLTAQIHCDAFLSIYLAGWHPWDAEADSIDEELLFTMRTSGDKCKAAWDSEGLTSAEQLLQSYVLGSQGWGTNKRQSVAQRATQGFQPLQHECLLFGRKFKADTVSAVLDMFNHPQFSAWNYTQERMAPHIHV